MRALSSTICDARTADSNDTSPLCLTVLLQICGNVSTPCLHKNAFTAVAAHGVMIQTWGSGPFVNPKCDPSVCAMGNPLCCEDIEYPGYYGCCTAECEAS